MTKETQKEKDYWSLLESTQREAYPSFVDALSAQIGSVAENGRAAVIEFQDGSKPSVQKFRKSGALRSYLDKPSDGTVRRRAFILQGLPRNYVQVLGSGLQVPPSFFAAHWTGLGIYKGNLLNRTPRHYDVIDRFILTSPKLHRARINQQEGDRLEPIYYMSSSIQRPISRVTVFGDFKGPLLSFEQLSFWRVCKGQSWDVVLLGDPSLENHVTWKDGSTRSVDHSDFINLVDPIIDEFRQVGSWYAPYNPNTPLPQNSAEWKTMGQAPGMQSIFEDIIRLYPYRDRRVAVDSMTCSDICRRLVLSAWVAWLRVVESQIVQEQYFLSIGATANKPDSATWLEKSWTRPWTFRDFGRLIRAKSALESIDADLYHNMDALGIGGKHQATEDWEAEAWKSLQNTVRALKTRVDMISQAYMQAVSIQETIASKKQTRQVGYLTSFATLFLPASLIAAIFSMGGQFSAGGNLFWVYWAIAVPVMISGCLLLFTKLGGRFLGRGREAESFV